MDMEVIDNQFALACSVAVFSFPQSKTVVGVLSLWLGT